ncbi:phospholipase A2-like [Pollicipes pollicipes]|uniref:phospholipase A2-like n=1 Tax=Pollicipes pollicipes TaxID=41117 RepID=UPI001885968A|nr:phospholipase A2-like [Pollicipes pollicipes]
MRPSKPVCGRLLLLLAVMGGRVVSRSSRPRRSVGQFGDMIRQHVGREALLYNVYGNYCGASSRYDLLPIDEVDRCCLEHDLCYRASRTAECSDSWLGPYWTRYTWAHQDGVLMCERGAGTLLAAVPSSRLSFAWPEMRRPMRHSEREELPALNPARRRCVDGQPMRP